LSFCGCAAKCAVKSFSYRTVACFSLLLLWLRAWRTISTSGAGTVSQSSHPCAPSSSSPQPDYRCLQNPSAVVMPSTVQDQAFRKPGFFRASRNRFARVLRCPDLERLEGNSHPSRLSPQRTTAVVSEKWLFCCMQKKRVAPRNYIGVLGSVACMYLQRRQIRRLAHGVLTEN
jgi:hypothetical protein